MARSAGRCLEVVVCLHLSACQSVVGLDDLQFAEAGSSALGYRDEVLRDAPIGYWRLDESTPTKAANEVPSGVEGTFGGTVTLGEPGALLEPSSTGASFDGDVEADPDRVDFGNVFGFEGTAPFSIEVWMAARPISDPFYERVLSKRSAEAGYSLELHPTDGLLFIRRQAPEEYDQVMAPSPSMSPTATYVHVAITYAEGTTLLYLDGELAASNAGSIEIPQTASDFVLGNQSDHDAPAFVGWLDELAIYDHALEPERVAAHFGAASR